MNTKTIIHWALCLVAILTLAACSKKNEPQSKSEGEYDIIELNPIYLYVEVQDPSGVDLINPHHPNSITKQPVRIVVKGKTFELDNKAIRRELRYYMPEWYGIYYEAPKEEGKLWRLVIGEFDGAEEGVQEVTLDWGDGTSNQLRYNNAVHYKGIGFPDIDLHFYLDGKEVPSDTFRITKQVPD